MQDHTAGMWQSQDSNQKCLTSRAWFCEDSGEWQNWDLNQPGTREGFLEEAMTELNLEGPKFPTGFLHPCNL